MRKYLAEHGRVSAAVAATVVLGAGLAYFALGPAQATHGANKVGAVGSGVEVISPGVSDDPILTTTVNTSDVADLLLSVSAECAITTEVTTVGNDLARAEGKVVMRVTVDGEPVPVTAPPSPSDVVFCNRIYERETTLFDDTNATIRTFMATRSANAFNWVTLNVGHGEHVIEVFADLITSATDGASALAAVGNRTLVVEPVHMSNDETLAN